MDRIIKRGLKDQLAPRFPSFLPTNVSLRNSQFCFSLIALEFELRLLNFSCSGCRNYPRGIGYNAALQDSKIYVSEDDARSPLNYRQNPLGSGALSYGAMRSAARDGCSSNEEITFLCHGNHGEQCSDSNTGLTGLALALTIHAILEGLAIGLQTKIAEVREYAGCDFSGTMRERERDKLELPMINSAVYDAMKCERF